MPKALLSNLSKIRRIHFTGIKGVGMTGLAVIAHEMGFEVQGSDVSERFITDEILETRGIPVHVGFGEDILASQIDLVIATGAHGGKMNPQVQAAIASGIPALMHAEALGLFAQGKKIIAVAGTHGKSTTSALLAWVLVQAGLDPSYLVGTSEITGLGVAAHRGAGEYFVIEADEYMTCPATDPTPRFLHLAPEITVITNIEHDHPDRFKDLADVRSAFKALIEKTSAKGKVIGCIDNQVVADLLRQTALAVTTYGTTPAADLRIEQIRVEAKQTRWSLITPQETLQLSTPLAGAHNALNATAAWQVARELGVAPELVTDAIANFGGLKRRFEIIGEHAGVLVIDDYAHHPTEIRATLRAARGRFPGRRQVVIFQAHTYSRTTTLYEDFVRAFADADVVVLLPIFASARESTVSDMTSERLVEGIRKHHPHVLFLENQSAVLDWLAVNAQPGDVVLTLGAGDVYKIGERFVG